MKRFFILLVVALITSTATFAQRNNTVSGAMMVNTTEIIKVKKERIKKEHKLADITRGYEQEVALTWFEMTMHHNGADILMDINYIGGYRFNHNFFAGIGTGFGFSDFDTKFIPLYAHLRAYLMKTKWSPFLAFSGGCHFTLNNDGAIYGMYEFTPGVCYRHSKELAFNFQFGYSGTIYDNMGANGFTMKFGVTF